MLPWRLCSSDSLHDWKGILIMACAIRWWETITNFLVTAAHLFSSYPFISSLQIDRAAMKSRLSECQMISQQPVARAPCKCQISKHRFVTTARKWQGCRAHDSSNLSTNPARILSGFPGSPSCLPGDRDGYGTPPCSCDQDSEPISSAILITIVAEIFAIIRYFS